MLAVAMAVDLTLHLTVVEGLFLTFFMLLEHSLYVEQCVLQGMQATAAADIHQKPQ